MTEFRSIDSLADFVNKLPNAHRIIGLAGSPGAGKSTVGAELVARLPSAVLLPMDGFHLPQSTLVQLGRGDRMGAPDTFDIDAFIATLTAIRTADSSPVLAPGFDRETEEPVPGAIRILPELSTTIVVEGNYLLLDEGGWENVAPLIDVTVFVRLERSIRLDRLIERHIRYGKSPEDARAWALGPDERNAVAIEASAARADHVIEL